jgi:Mycothiol maleylpyruvate isomerase N-terminal domain
MADDVPGRDDAIRLAREDRERTNALLASIDPSAFGTTGLGGGTWSPKDLVGHLETWEENALGALDAWDRGERAPIVAELQALGTDEFNKRAVERKASMSAEQTRSSAAATHGRMLERFAALSDERWASRPVEGDDATVGARLGSTLGGELGLFRHDPDHWRDLESFAAEHPA